MRDNEIVEQLIRLLGGSDNILSVTNCMTRLRVVVKSEACIQEGELKAAEGVLGLVHDRSNAYEIVVGPGNSRRFADICHEKGLAAVVSSDVDWRENKASLEVNRKRNPVRDGLKMLGDIFVPLIPGVIAAGLCAGFAALISQLIPGYKDITVLHLLCQLLMVINIAFMTYVTAWAGYRAAERFGATPILGGMLGMITSLQNIDEISQLLGLYNEAAPLSSVLQTGKGGILSVICGVYILSLIERFIRRRMPANLDVIFTPLLTMLLCAVPYILLVMPVFGLISDGIAWLIGQAYLSENIFVRILVGYVSTAVFLPMVACGMHHGMIALYAVQLQKFGRVLLYPALAMSGAGQVGAAIALYMKAKRMRHQKLCAVIGGALPAGILGIGEPLIYGVTLPMGRPFLTAGLGAGFGGAFVTACGVAATTWGTSGILGVFVMTAGEGGALHSTAMYVVGLLISCAAAFFITMFRIPNEMVAGALGGMETSAGELEHTDAEATCAANEESVDTAAALCANSEPVIWGQEQLAQVHRMVRHGDTVLLGVGAWTFEYVIEDSVGIHARPASALAKLASQFDAQILVQNGERAASAKSMIELMGLDAGKGSRLRVRITGKDAAAAAKALQRFMRENL